MGRFLKSLTKFCSIFIFLAFVGCEPKRSRTSKAQTEVIDIAVVAPQNSEAKNKTQKTHSPKLAKNTALTEYSNVLLRMERKRKTETRVWDFSGGYLLGLVTTEHGEEQKLIPFIFPDPSVERTVRHGVVTLCWSESESRADKQSKNHEFQIFGNVEVTNKASNARPAPGMKSDWESSFSMQIASRQWGQNYDVETGPGFKSYTGTRESSNGVGASLWIPQSGDAIERTFHRTLPNLTLAVVAPGEVDYDNPKACLLYTSPSPRD